MQQVLFITAEPFLAKILEDALLSVQVKCMSLSELSEDFTYLLDDLNPELVIVDESAYSRWKSLIEASFSQSKQDLNSLFLQRSEDIKPQGFKTLEKMPIKLELLCQRISELMKKTKEL